MGWLKQNWSKIYFTLAALILAYVLGMVTAALQLKPLKWMVSAVSAYKDLTTENNYKHYAGIRPEKFIRPARIPNNGGVVLHKPELAQQGITLITSMWDHKQGMNLIDMEGNTLHSWRVSITDIWSDTPNWPPKNITDWNTLVHGAVMYPNGDIIFNFEYNGLVKIDKCSNVIWKIKNGTHHSIEFDPFSENLWIPGHEIYRTAFKKYPLIDPPIHEDRILKVSPEGKILKRLSILEILYNSGYESLLFANGTPGVKRNAIDISHLNDIEVLSAELAGQFPLFEAGDIMVSLRNLNLILIIDGQSEKVKWSMVGPFLHQHDPDFLPDGRIAVYDNRAEDTHTDGTFMGGSRIILIDPVTRQIDTFFESTAKHKFYSYNGGKHQFQPNGNDLIVEHTNGTLLEVTPQGEIAWMYTNMLPDNLGKDEVYRVSQGTRFTKDYATFLNNPSQCQH